MNTERSHDKAMEARSSAASAGPAAAESRPNSTREASLFEASQINIYNKLNQICRDRNNGTATLYHYSGAMCRETVELLFDNGYHVDLIIQNPEIPRKLGAGFQEDRIIKSIGQYQTELKGRGRSRRGKLDIYVSDVPLTIRAASIDENLIAIGWYMYGISPRGNPDFPGDVVHLRGHNCCGALIANDSSEFAIALNFLKHYHEQVLRSESEPIWSSWWPSERLQNRRPRVES